jgi:hypothetical protein
MAEPEKKTVEELLAELIREVRLLRREIRDAPLVAPRITEARRPGLRRQPYPIQPIRMSW